MIRNLNESDWDHVKSIYLQGIRTKNATFESECSVQEFDEWNKSKIKDSSFVFTKEHRVKGWSALTAVSSRCIYAGVAEVSVYVDADAQGLGIGKSLLKALINYAETNNIWTLQAGIFPENKASIAIHEKLGFRKVGYREKIGKLNGEWRNTLLFERRSTTIE